MGGIGGASALGNLTQLGNMSVAYGIGKAEAADAWDYWKKSLLRGPSYRMQGLRSAGINPILAAGGGIGATTSAGALIKSSSKASGTAANPAISEGQRGLLTASTTAQQTLATKHSAEANLASLRFRLESADLPRKGLEEQFYNSKRGARVVDMKQHNDALPNTWPGLTAKGLMQRQNLYQGSGIQKMMNPDQQTAPLRK